jgi:hypothetical protein
MHYRRSTPLLIVSIVLLFAGAVFSQSKVEWRVFAPEGEEFATEAPEVLVTQTVPSYPPDHTYSAHVGRTYFFVFSSRSSKDDKEWADLPYIHGFRESGKNERRGEMVAETFSFEDGEGFYHEALYFRTGRAKYLFHLLSDVPNDKQMARFFEKLNIGKVNDSYASPDPLAPIEDEVAQPKSTMPGGTAPSRSQASAVPVIMEKPRPGYNNEARLRNISGTVSLRVQFLADGTIGNITPLMRLPFGLTDQTIKVVRAIKFRPAVVDGKPVDSEKVIEYTFSIY